MNETYPEIEFDEEVHTRLPLGRRLSIGAQSAAGAYAKATEGVVFDPDRAMLHTAENALEEARRLERERPDMEKFQTQFGTRARHEKYG